MKLTALILCLAACVLSVSAVSVPFHSAVTAQDESDAARRQELSRLLVNVNPLVRRQAAEDIARIADPWFKTMVEGCRLQEKDAKVRLALDWALYRLGNSPALFEIVKNLDSNRYAQALGYLKELESPDPLYAFLPNGKKNTQVGIIEALGAIGNSNTLGVIQPYRSSSQREVARAAVLAQEQITFREEQSADTNKARPRRIDNAPDKSANP